MDILLELLEITKGQSQVLRESIQLGVFLVIRAVLLVEMMF